MSRELELKLTQTNELQIKNYEEQLEIAKEILEQNQVFEIKTDDDCKKAKEIRSKFNGVIKQIDRRRIDLVEELTSTFTEQCNELKTLFDNRQKEFGKVINEYVDSKKTVVAPKTDAKKFTATIKYYDEKISKKLEDFCIKNNCELTIK